MEKIILLVLCECKDRKQLMYPQVHSYLKKGNKIVSVLYISGYNMILKWN